MCDNFLLNLRVENNQHHKKTTSPTPMHQDMKNNRDHSPFPRCFEVCTGNEQSVVQAVAGGAQRVELCSALSLDGLTPSIGLLREVRSRFPALTLQVLIRPREGNFVYSEEEIRIMEHDIEAALPFADGIVCGALTPQGAVDGQVLKRLLVASAGKPFTFHRAFDACSQPDLAALDQLMEAGCTRLLTSGRCATAWEGRDNLKRYVEHVGNDLIILAGGGVKGSNARTLMSFTGVREIHGSVSKIHADGQKVTDAEDVREVLREMDTLG